MRFGRASRTAVVLACVAATSVSVTAGPAGANGTRAGRPLAVTAFQTQESHLRLINRSANAITTVGVDGVVVRSSGNGVTAPVPSALRQRTRAHHLNLRAELLVNNYSNRIGDFSEPLANALLSSAAHIRTAAAQLAADVAGRGFDGISVDLEALHPRDRFGLTAFVARLRRDLPSGATLSICVESFTRVGAYEANGYQLGRLAGLVDRVILMTYDQHGPWENKPGPVGALPWQRAGVRAARHFVAARHLDLGVAGYGYAWRPHSNVTLSVAAARKLAGHHARFDSRAGEWTATLPDGSTLWWSDHRSYLLRADLARRMGLHGLAMWDLRLSDPLV